MLRRQTGSVTLEAVLLVGIAIGVLLLLFGVKL